MKMKTVKPSAKLAVRAKTAAGGGVLKKAFRAKQASTHRVPSSRRTAHYDSRTGLLGLKGEPAAKLIERINRGFPYGLVEAFRESSDLPMETIADLIGVPSRTLNRRKLEGRLRADESERLLRVARVVDKAVDLFEGDPAAAMRWLTAPQPALGEQSALAFCRTDVGAREVEDLIGRLEHGVFS